MHMKFSHLVVCPLYMQNNHLNYNHVSKYFNKWITNPDFVIHCIVISTHNHTHTYSLTNGELQSINCKSSYVCLFCLYDLSIIRVCMCVSMKIQNIFKIPREMSKLCCGIAVYFMCEHEKKTKVNCCKMLKNLQHPSEFTLLFYIMVYIYTT